MTATVSILVAHRDQVLKIPKTALRFQPKLSEQEREGIEQYLRERRGGPRDGTPALAEAQRKRWQGAPKVWTLTPEGFLRPIPVRLGVSDEQYAELIGDSLQEGQEVIIGLMDQDGREGGASRPARTSGPPRLRF